MREGDLLTSIYERSRDLGPWVRVGPGDDCAVLAGEPPPQGAPPDLLVTVDHLIEDQHYFGPLRPSGSPTGPGLGTSIDLIARKAIARSVSDIAAMGGTPRWSLGTLAFSDGYPHERAEELCAAVAMHARALGCPMVGGDIASTTGPVVMTITVAGVPHPARGPILRRGARPGDAVWVTGRIGGALASGRHLTFEPRVREAQWLAALPTAGAVPSSAAHTTPEHPIHAMIDLSDGLGVDAGRVAIASGVDLVLDSALVPLHDDVVDWRAGVGDGEDYELLFTADPALALPACVPTTGTRLTRIGVVRAAASGQAGRAWMLGDDRTPLDVTHRGWEHGRGRAPRSPDLPGGPAAPRDVGRTGASGGPR